VKVKLMIIENNSLCGGGDETKNRFSLNTRGKVQSMMVSLLPEPSRRAKRHYQFSLKFIPHIAAVYI